MRERELKEFLDIHAGETAWVFGKGPSLDSFDFNDAGPLRACVNDLVGTVPGSVYGFSNDRVLAWRDLYEPHHVLFTPKRTADHFFDDLPDCDVCIFSDYHGHDLNRDKGEMAKELKIGDGTLGSVLQVLHVMGVRKIVAIGIDGGGKHAKRTHWRTTLKNEHYKEYNTIRHSFIRDAEHLGIEIQFFNEDKDMSDGHKTVQFTSNTFVRGNPYSEGMVVRLIESDARDVVVCGRAVIVETVPEKKAAPQVEKTATAKKPVEVPEKRTVRRKRATKKKAGK